MIVALVAAAALGYVAFRGGAPPAGTGTVEQRVSALESGHLALQQQIQELRAGGGGTLTGAPLAAPPGEVPLPETIRIGSAPVLGSADARIALVEFSDFECPFCSRYLRDTFPQLKAEYIDTGKVRYVFRNFPLEQIHPRAMKSGEAAECAHRQGRFWPMHDRLFANQQALGDAELVAHAQAVGLNMGPFNQCLAGQTIAKMREDMDEGSRAGITGTPGFFVGTPGPDGNLRVTKRLIGAQPYANFKAALDEALNTL